jgi:hypothetical protein
MRQQLHPRYWQYPKRKEMFLDCLRRAQAAGLPLKAIKKADEVRASIDLKKQSPVYANKKGS